MNPGFIIDGYNLMHKVPELAELAGKDLEQARDRLVAMLARFKGRRQIRVVVVFDGDQASGGPARTRAGAMDVVFSRLPEKADERIVRMARSLANPKAWTVVSSDRKVRERAGACGVRTVGADEFLRTATPARARREDKPEMRTEDVAEWEEFFKKGRAD